MVRFHFLQHVAFEDPGYILDYAVKHNFVISKTLMYESATLPDLDEIDWLVIMGGPMNIYEYEKYLWLTEEKKFIESAIKKNKVVIGICLGAQLIADCLGAKVYHNHTKEIGWLPVQCMNKSENTLLNSFPDMFTAFHWHGDTFDIPEGAIHFARSVACANQAFLYSDRVLALQFHCESTRTSIESLIEHCSDELMEVAFIQTVEMMRNSISEEVPRIHAIMDSVLDRFTPLFRP